MVALPQLYRILGLVILGALPVACGLDASGLIPWPDLTFVLDVPASEAMRRVTARHGQAGPALEIYETTPLQARLAAGYSALAGEGLANVLRIDGTRPMAEVTAALLAACIDAGL